VFLVAGVAAAALVVLWGLVGVVRSLRQAASQWTAAAVAERAGRRTVADGDDAALEYAGGTVVPPADEDDAAVFATDHGEPFNREGRTGPVPQETFEIDPATTG
jgi:hypothetical protein